MCVAHSPINSLLKMSVLLLMRQLRKTFLCFIHSQFSLYPTPTTSYNQLTLGDSSSYPVKLCHNLYQPARMQLSIFKSALSSAAVRCHLPRSPPAIIYRIQDELTKSPFLFSSRSSELPHLHIFPTSTTASV